MILRPAPCTIPFRDCGSDDAGRTKAMGGRTSPWPFTIKLAVDADKEPRADFHLLMARYVVCFDFYW